MNLFFQHKKSNQQHHSVRMVHKGKWKVIDLDGSIPRVGNKSGFSKSVDDELWVMLLEEAWKKLYGSQRCIETVTVEEVLHGLTGAPIRKISLKCHKSESEEIWGYLLKATAEGYAMVVSSSFDHQSGIKAS